MRENSFFTSWWMRTRERSREGRDKATSITIKALPQMHFLQLGLTSSSFQNLPN
jgi:hypothetical protein